MLGSCLSKCRLKVISVAKQTMTVDIGSRDILNTRYNVDMDFLCIGLCGF